MRWTRCDDDSRRSCNKAAADRGAVLTGRENVSMRRSQTVGEREHMLVLPPHRADRIRNVLTRAGCDPLGSIPQHDRCARWRGMHVTGCSRGERPHLICLPAGSHRSSCCEPMTPGLPFIPPCVLFSRWDPASIQNPRVTPWVTAALLASRLALVAHALAAWWNQWVRVKRRRPHKNNGHRRAVRSVGIIFMDQHLPGGLTNDSTKGGKCELPLIFSPIYLTLIE